MEKLVNTEKEEIGKRIRSLRGLLSLTQAQLAKAVGISKGTLASIELGLGFSGDYILAISHFFSMELAELVEYKRPLPDELEFRERIKRYHQKIKSTAYQALDKSPDLNAVIEFRLAKTNFLSSKPRSVQEIIEFCKDEYALTFKSSVVSQALTIAVKAGLLKRVPKDKRNYLYQAIKRSGK